MSIVVLELILDCYQDFIFLNGNCQNAFVN